jgi:photosystem II PsbU protein
MKRLLAWFLGGVALAGLLLTLWLPGAAQAADLRNVADDKIAESAGKVDLNNSSVRRFQQLKLDLTPRQKELFEKYKANFTVTPPSIALNEGFDRINDGVYR